MSTSIDLAFVRQYEKKVHLVFQRTGSYLKSTVRFRPNVLGSSTTFQKIGTGTATTKRGRGFYTAATPCSACNITPKQPPGPMTVAIYSPGSAN